MKHMARRIAEAKPTVQVTPGKRTSSAGRGGPRPPPGMLQASAPQDQQQQEEWAHDDDRQLQDGDGPAVQLAPGFDPQRLDGASRCTLRDSHPGVSLSWLSRCQR